MIQPTTTSIFNPKYPFHIWGDVCQLLTRTGIDKVGKQDYTHARTHARTNAHTHTYIDAYT